MLFIVPVQFLADVKQFDPFRPVAGAPFQNPGAHEQGKELNNQVITIFTIFAFHAVSTRCQGGWRGNGRGNGWVGALRACGSSVAASCAALSER